MTRRAARARTTSRAETRAVGFVAFDGVASLDLVGPLEVFATANELTASDKLPPPYRTWVLGMGSSQIVAESGLTLGAHGQLGDLGPLDTLVVPGGSGLRDPRTHERVVAALKRHGRQTRRLASVCTGIYGLAATGWLDGRRVATHWRFAEDVARRFPRVQVDSDAIYIRDGRYSTSAGVTAGIDLALALVEEDLGPSLALAVARELVVFVKRQGGQTQYSATLQRQVASTDPLADLEVWIGEHLDDDLSITSLANRSHLSPRQFTRRFAASFGTTPGTYVMELRMEEARRLLLEGVMDVGQVASALGFRGADVFRRAFARRFGAGPREYRARFAAR